MRDWGKQDSFSGVRVIFWWGGSPLKCMLQGHELMKKVILSWRLSMILTEESWKKDVESSQRIDMQHWNSDVKIYVEFCWLFSNKCCVGESF